MTRRAILAAIVLLAASRPCAAADRYAVIVTGASGGESYALQYDTWRSTFASALQEKLGFDAARITILSETSGPGLAPATAADVKKTFADLGRRLAKDDLLLVLLIGHGTTVSGEEAKFNLVGPDLRASEWGDLLRPIAAKLIFVNTASASFPFMARIAGRGRVVLTATDSVMQQYDTVFPEFFVKGLDDPAADLDKNGRRSIWEVFSYASAKVRQWFEERGRLPTERPILDDTGDGIGREAQGAGDDGTLAGATYLDGDAAPATASAADPLIRRRAALEAEIESLKIRRPVMAEDAFAAELERLLTELARVSAQIRDRQ